MAIFRKRGKWYINYYCQGGRIREAVGTSKRAAEGAGRPEGGDPPAAL